jgi:inward rectifier potassium channel
MVVREHKRPHFDARARMPNVDTVARGLSPYEDAYHWVLTRTWTRFFTTVALAFVLVNAAFAGLYSLEPGGIGNADTFADRFFFSVQTLGTIGYGVMVPATHWANVVVSIEALVGLLFAALVTGLTFARFARPTARILFSEKAVIGPRDGVPHLMFRMANYRRNQIAEATLHALLLVTEKTTEGDVMRRPHPLSLVLSSNHLFSHSWTAMHRIDETSPFFGDNAMDRLRSGGVEIYLTLTGVDETLAQTIHARVRYTLDDIVHNARFADILRVEPDGTRIIDYDRFHEIRERDGGPS